MAISTPLSYTSAAHFPLSAFLSSYRFYFLRLGLAVPLTPQVSSLTFDCTPPLKQAYLGRNVPGAREGGLRSLNSIKASIIIESGAQKWNKDPAKQRKRRTRRNCGTCLLHHIATFSGFGGAKVCTFIYLNPERSIISVGNNIISTFYPVKMQYFFFFFFFIAVADCYTVTANIVFIQPKNKHQSTRTQWTQQLNSVKLYINRKMINLLA